MKDADGQIIYIGKAKSLQSRVRSHFRPHAHDGRRQFRALVSSVRGLEYIMADTELEALILEANLIKTHKPKYNISLKDDKKYPFIRITNEAFPRIIVTQDVEKDGSRYLGPYTDVKAMRRTLERMHRLFRIRSCDYALPCDNVRVCLDYEIKRCDGPCEGLISEADYRKIVDEAVLFLTVRHTQVALKARMRQSVVGLAKRLEEVFLPGHSDSQNIPKTSSSIQLLQTLRDESHRFAVTYLRKLRQKWTLGSELDEIEGVGPARWKALLRHFGSVTRIRKADAAAGVGRIGPALA